MTKKMYFLISFVLVLSLGYTSKGAPSAIRIDFDSSTDVNTEPSFTSMVISQSGMTVNGITIDLGPYAAQARRENPYDPEFPIPYTELYRDFIFGSPQNRGLSLTLWGLGENQTCNLAMYNYDAQSEPTRAADWYSNGSFIFTADFNGGAVNWPDDITDYNNMATVTADKFGRIVFASDVNEASSNENDYFSFLNALLLTPTGTFKASDYATRPQPFDGTEDIAPTETVTWRIGARSETRDVYMGTSFNDVSTASRGTPKGVLLATQPGNTFDYGGAAGRLKLDTEYFWRIDEVNTTPGPTTFWTGEVWDFITLPYTVVDNFNGYATSAALLNVWSDYTANGSAATIALESIIVRDGNSMKYLYEDFYSPYYAESDATMTNLVMDPNWFAMGAKSISIWFRGTVGNDANELMSMKLTDSDTPVHTATVLYDGSPNDIKTAEWREWVIDLSQFATVNMRKVAKIAIRFGDGVIPVGSGTGTVYFDNLRLYATRCVLAKRGVGFTPVDYAPGGVVAGDCVVDHQELQIMANTWLDTDAVFETNSPGDANLVLYYPLNEGEGNNVYTGPPDPCNATHNGVFYTFANNKPAWAAPGAPIIGGNSCVYINGAEGVRINCGTYGQQNLGIGVLPGDINAITVSVWVKSLGPRSWDSYLLSKFMGIVGKRGGWNDSTVIWMFSLTPSAEAFCFTSFQGGTYSAAVLSPYFGQWIHLAATYPNPAPDPQDTRNYARLFLNGRQVNSSPFQFSHGDDDNIFLSIGDTMDTNAWPGSPESFYGYIDEIRIYNHALEPNQIAYLADVSPEDGHLWVPIPSGAEVYDAEPEGQRIINSKDYALLANRWLTEDMFP